MVLKQNKDLSRKWYCQALKTFRIISSEIKILLFIISWWCFSCLHIHRIGIQYTDQLIWKTNFHFLFFFFFFFFIFLIFTKLSQVHGQYGSMLFLTKYESNLIVHGFCSPPITMGWLNLKICQNFVVAKFFLTFCGRINFYGWS